jgi:hypothetical protein
MDKTLELLGRLLPDFVAQTVAERIQGVSSTRIDLPVATGAEYFFRLWIEPEMQIGAELTAPDSDVNYF